VCDGSLSESKAADRCSAGLSSDEAASLKTPTAAEAEGSRRVVLSTRSFDLFFVFFEEDGVDVR